MKKTPLPDGYVETWYDRQTRNWVTVVKDAAGNQIGDARFAGNSESAAFEHAICVRDRRVLGGAQ